MKFSKFYKLKNVDFDKINRAMLEDLQDDAFLVKNKKNISKFLLMTNEELQKTDFYTKYPHLV